MVLSLLKVFTPAFIAFCIGIGITPLLTHYLYKYKIWKKKPGKIALDGTDALEFGKLRTEIETKTPRMGGIVVWGSVGITTILLYALDRFFPGSWASKFDFFSRSQTWIPFTTLILGSLMGLLNDTLDVMNPEGEKGIHLRYRLVFVSFIALFIGWWFYAKLGANSISLLFGGTVFVGWGIIPIFIFVMVFLYASGVIDGIDGLSGGVFGSIFFAYALIAFYQNQIDIAAFSATVVGALLAFLWFNIPPARFWMTETGSMGLTMTIATIAFMTDTLGEGRGVSVLPIIALILVATVLSNIVQVFSKKFRRGKKVFRIAPLHHHFEAIGWPGSKVTMRYWILSIVFAIVGVSLALLK
ncbi:MAG: hypothetical protein JO026_03685 [Patescibacteria group bacterium]|nr:hypothetical protein [Patescibacteria group bacterium]